MYPTLEKIKELAQSGEYRRIPVCRELYTQTAIHRRSHEDFANSQQTLLSAGKCQPDRGVGTAILFWDMSHPWRSPVQTEC